MSRARSRRPPERRKSMGGDIGSRLIVALALVAFAVLIVDYGGIVFLAGVLVAGLLCLDELYRLFDRIHPVKIAGFVGLIGLLLAAEYGTQTQILMVAAACVPLTFLLTIASPNGSALGIATTLLGVWWIGIALAHAILLRSLPHGGGAVADVLVGTALGDTGAYLGGRWFGRRPLAPAISPNKTLEGLLIGMMTAVLGVWFASLYQDWMPNKGDALLLGLAIALAAPLGDLFESYIKRESGKKDAGRLLGAHGGVLDRLDAILFTAVVGFYVWNAMF